MLNKYKKLEDDGDAIARFCCSVDNSRGRKNPNHSNWFNNNIDQEYLSVNNNN